MIPSPAAARALLQPGSIAVVGDTPTEGRGGLLHEQLVRRGYTGRIVPVNPKYETVRGLPCYPSVAAGGPVEFAAVTLGPARALAAMADCIAGGARAVLFIGSGFGAVGGVGAEIQHELRRLADEHDIALAGPNCYGLANVRAGFAPFFGALPEPLVPGPVALISGSGALTHAVADGLAARGIGFGYVVTVGNEAGVDAADYLELIAEDPEIRVVACYLEAFRDAGRFAAAARKAAAAGQRVVVLTVGRSAASRRASAAHTGALASEGRVIDAYLAGLGASSVRDLDELAEVIELAAYVPRVGRGPVTVSTISGGGSGVLADVAAAVDLSLAEFSEPTRQALRAVVPGEAALGNPIDLTGLATDDLGIITGALRAVDAEPGEDTGLHLFAINTPYAAGEADRELYRRMAGAVVRTAPQLHSPVALLTLSSGRLDPGLVELAHAAGVPLLLGARAGLAAIAALRDPASTTAPTTPAADGGTAEAVARRLAADPTSTLTPTAVAELLRELGLTTADGGVVTGEAAAVEVAGRLGYPVVAKI